MERKVSEMEREKYNKLNYDARFSQVGDSSRSIKKRSYKIKEDLVIDHETGKKCSFKDFNKGKIELLC